tara:strand:+ start:1616 stop:2041 length:426 start_codon:yes stop_codon:yes gene_type:complete
MYIKKNAKMTFRTGRRSNFKRNNNKFRNKGNISQQYNKYLKLAKEASASSDRIQSEYYYQFTDHYYRLMVELGITIDDNDLNESKPIPAQSNENTESSLEEKKDSESDAKVSIDEDSESIESIPFISEPPRKKTKSKKVSV